VKPIKLLDAAFLHAETPATPMHVGALFLLDPPAGRPRKPFYRRFRETVARRLGASEVFTRKLATLPFGLANPMWVTTADIDLDYHVRRSVLPRPGNRRQLENRVAHLHEPLLDRSRPLWELHVIEGLEGGQVALYVKIHHAGLDGLSAQLALQVFADTAPGARATARQVPWPEPDDGSPARLLAAGVLHQLDELRRLPQRLVQVAGAATRLARARDARTPATPRTVLNQVVSGRRRLATTEIPLDEARRVAQLADSTVNDLMLCVTAGALRRWLLQRGLLPAQPLFAGVPVSARAQGDTEQAIQVTFISVALHTGIADPLERLAAIHRSSEVAKQSAGALKSLVPEDMPSLGLPWLLGGAAWLASHPDVADRVPLPFNLVVSNVPGPPAPIYIAGARVMTYLPISIVYHGVGLNVSLYSYDGRLFVGIVSCADLMPDADPFARLLEKEFEALRTAVSVKRPARQPKPPRRVSRASSAPRRGKPRPR
jgi:WS/DGAT/MGAT family acyltransferase